MLINICFTGSNFLLVEYSKDGFKSKTFSNFSEALLEALKRDYSMKTINEDFKNDTYSYWLEKVK